MKLAKWMSKHRILSIVLFSVLLVLVFTPALAILGSPPANLILTDAILIFIVYCMATSAPMKVMQEGIMALNKTNDPYPLLESTNELLTYPLADSSRLIVVINNACALIASGDTQKAYDVLSSINIDKHISVVPHYSFIYLNNLACVCIEIGRVQEAKELLKRMNNAFELLKNKKQMAVAHHLIAEAEAALAFCEGDVSRSLELIERLPEERKETVEISLLLARIYLQTGDKENAKRMLYSVVSRGNKRIEVSRARELINAIEGNSK